MFIKDDTYELVMNLRSEPNWTIITLNPSDYLVVAVYIDVAPTNKAN